ncbi:putative TPR repeat-containing protein [Coleophoma cylindrospora]|uniref:Putative TPR repeat-containing protein n=1 Tax=Coleophoma cylindrospora TaxID=1849047 RepID=A0A3D8R5W5_9HELO|nr:putative TPR repeat-containing protein [Coleophoma cylindrospora]
MAASPLENQSWDALICQLEALKEIPELSDIVASYLNGDYKVILKNATSQKLFQKLAQFVDLSAEQQPSAFTDGDFASSDVESMQVIITGLAAFDAFLQANVTGPPLVLTNIYTPDGDVASFTEKCLRSLDIDGVSVYQYIPHVEVFCLARMVFANYFPRIVGGNFRDCKWMRVRINAYHQRLLSGMAGGKLSDSVFLQNQIEKDLKNLDLEIMSSESSFSTEAKVQYHLEKAQIYIMQGLDFKAKENVQMAKTVSGFNYALTGALGKRTKFQQNDLSQLVVLAKSKEEDAAIGESSNLTALKESLPSTSEQDKTDGTAPTALDLNDDTLFESIQFAKTSSEKVEQSSLPAELAEMTPDNQPQLKPLDQITLLTEATLKDTYSPLDNLNSEEILPYAVRVLSDKPTNWQIYTQALLVRSRIESHRSRTQERSVLQLQAIVDQIIADTENEETAAANADGIPQIQVTSFLPRAKADESAPVTERLRYIYPLHSPTRWEIETELAFAWSSAGSLVSALEIFKRLRLWAEVALCYFSVNQEEKARQIVRRQLYYSSKGPEMDKYGIDDEEVVKEQWDGEMRTPPPPHSPRLWCILGDLEQDPECWKRSWEISKNRYPRAQRTLGEYYTKQGDLESAREAYMKATVVNRQNDDSWNRLGDIDLRVGNWDGAIVAFQQSIMIDETDAKTYNNLGSALLSKHAELLHLQKANAQDIKASDEIDDDEEVALQVSQPSPKDVLRQALSAFKRGATLAHDNWKIWDNVITIAGRMSPPSFPEILLGLRAVLRIRGPSIGEEAVDIDVLRALITEVITRDRDGGEMVAGIWVPPRGSLARATIELVDAEIVPLITKRAELWALVEKLAMYRRDYAGALACAEKSWRMATQSEGEKWLEDVEAWKGVATATDGLVSALENYGPMERNDGTEVEKGWKTKARSAVRGILGKAKGAWEDTEEYEMLKGRLDELKAAA